MKAFLVHFRISLTGLMQKKSHPERSLVLWNEICDGPRQALMSSQLQTFIHMAFAGRLRSVRDRLGVMGIGTILSWFSMNQSGEWSLPTS
ncbi:MAG: hypothetical protein CM15mP77_2420 [Synechococcus sp.]|nr:MAG: hypothetical protein CM15mP77_2420 [Synechococcus sp.]